MNDLNDAPLGGGQDYQLAEVESPDKKLKFGNFNSQIVGQKALDLEEIELKESNIPGEQPTRAAPDFDLGHNLRGVEEEKVRQIVDINDERAMGQSEVEF